MRRSKLLTASLMGMVVAGLVGLWLYRRVDARDVTVYRFSTIERGNIETSVSATGALSAVRTVQVGTQVSGQVAQIFVDFNDRVKKGQLLARIDPTLQQQAVLDAQAGLERSDAELAQARREHDRNQQLFESRVLAAAELELSTSKLATAEASRKSSRIALDRAQRNLSYTSIYAPIDGVVVERNVDVGQTVAASLSAPQLFLIANDLSQMQILANVDESDIGQIHEGCPVRFGVQSYSTESFAGSVQQVRLQSTTRENVVNYTVVVAVENPDGKLLPGMTATARFVIASLANTLTVPNAALRVRPAGDTARARTGRTGRGTGGNATIWHLDASGKLAALPVRTGLTDGQRTSVSGPGLEAGMKVIVGLAESGAPAATGNGSTNPLQPTGGGGRRPGGF